MDTYFLNNKIKSFEQLSVLKMCENVSDVATGQNGCRETALNCDLNNDAVFSFVSDQQQTSFEACDEAFFLEQILSQVSNEESYSVVDQSSTRGPQIGF